MSGYGQATVIADYIAIGYDYQALVTKYSTENNQDALYTLHSTYKNGELPAAVHFPKDTPASPEHTEKLKSQAELDKAKAKEEAAAILKKAGKK